MLLRCTHSGETGLLEICHLRKIASTAAEFRSFGPRTGLSFILVLLSLLSVPAPAWGQNQNKTAEPPLIVRIVPMAAAPGTNIKVEGYRLGANLEKGGRVLFGQGANEYEVAYTGGGYETANLKQGVQDFGTVVPDALQPGPCELIVEVNGRRSLPFNFQINIPATAPVITQIRPMTPRPSELIWIDGSGFAASDEVELIDAVGGKHRFDRSLATSDPN